MLPAGWGLEQGAGAAAAWLRESWVDREHQAALHTLLAEGILPALGAPAAGSTEPLVVPEGADGPAGGAG